MQASRDDEQGSALQHRSQRCLQPRSKLTGPVGHGLRSKTHRLIEGHRTQSEDYGKGIAQVGVHYAWPYLQSGQLKALLGGIAVVMVTSTSI